MSRSHQCLKANVKKRLKELGKTQTWLGDQLEMPQSHLSARLSGKSKLSLEQLDKIAAALEMKTFQLIFDSRYADEIEALHKTIAIQARKLEELQNKLKNS